MKIMSMSKQEMKIMEWGGDKGPFFDQVRRKKDGAKKKDKRESEDDKMCVESIYIKKTGHAHTHTEREREEMTMITLSLLNRNRHLFGNVS